MTWSPRHRSRPLDRPLTAAERTGGDTVHVQGGRCGVPLRMMRAAQNVICKCVRVLAEAGWSAEELVAWFAELARAAVGAVADDRKHRLLRPPTPDEIAEMDDWDEGE